MYNFTKSTAGGLDIYTSFQKQGDTHSKRFGEGVTPANQATVNVYTQGEFSLDIDGAEYLMPAGSCSLDVPVAAYPAGAVATETVLSPRAVRCCVSTANGVVGRSLAELSPGAPVAVSGTTLVFVLHGEAVVHGVTMTAGGFALAHPGGSITGVGRVLLLRHLAPSQDTGTEP